MFFKKFYLGHKKKAALPLPSGIKTSN